MKYLCLIHLDEKLIEAMPSPELDQLNASHLDLNDQLRDSRHFVDAEALAPGKAARCVRVRDGKRSVTDGPFAEAKEVIAGFYLIEARDFDEALAIAARIPSAALGTVEVRETRQLEVPGRAPRY